MEPPKKKVLISQLEDLSTSKEEKKGWCRQRFREEWCTEAEFTGWLEPVPDDPFRAWCSVCHCGLTVGRSELLKHAHTQKHKRAMTEAKSNSGNIFSILDNSAAGGNDTIISLMESGKTDVERTVDGNKVLASDSRTVQMNDVKASLGRLTSRPHPTMKKVDESLMKAELQFATFALQHNLSSEAIDQLGDLISSLAERPDVISKINMTKNKCAALVCSVFAKSIQQELHDTLRETCFSVIVDEMTLHEGYHIVCLIARYFSNSRNAIKNELLEAFVVEDVAIDGYVNSMLLDVFERHKIPVINVIGLAIDHAGVVGGHIDQLKTSLFGENADATVFNCTHRSMTEVAMRAVEALPNSLQQIAKYLGHYIVAEGNRNTPARNRLMHDDIGWVSTRWLVKPQCIRQLIHQLPTFVELVEKEAATGEAPIADALFNMLIDPYTKAHLLFLNYILTPLQNIEELFRFKDVVIHRLQHECQTQFRVICQHFLTPSTFMVDNLTKVDPYGEQNLLPLKDVFVGFECQVHLQGLDPEKNEFFLMQCRKCFQVIVSELQSRIPLNDAMLEQLSFLDPEIALKAEGRNVTPTPPDIGNIFGTSFELTRLLKEWNDLPQYFPSSDVDELKKMPLDVMWGVIGDMRSGSSGEELMFGELGRLAKLTLSLPLSNDDAASILEGLVKLNRQRAGAGLQRVLDTVLPCKQALKPGGNCVRLRITNQHRKFYCLGISKREDFDEDVDLFTNEES